MQVRLAALNEEWNTWLDHQSIAGHARARQGGAARVDRFMANSHFIGQRIEKYWRRESTVVHPPVSVEEFAPIEDVSDRYLWVSQMIRYKRPDIAIDAFNAPLISEARAITITPAKQST